MKALIIATTIALASTAAFADETTLKDLDKDEDGRISVEEASVDPKIAAVFAELDLDKDGFLSATEMPKKES